MNIPQPLIDSLQGVNGFDEAAFCRVHQSGKQVTSVRLNPLKPVSSFPNLESPVAVPWSQYGRYLGRRPSFTFDPLFHAGTYYVQEASSMFLEQAIRQHTDPSQPVRVLDLSAAPGGKSTHLQSLISRDSLLVSNEVIRTRANILKDNIVRWGGGNVVLSHNDPADFGRLENFFDVIVVDAPCSGSGLFRREPEAINEWSEHSVTLCAQRQQRILADIYPALKNGGLLVYSTCSYSPQEDEAILDWYTRDFELVSLPLTVEESWNITETRTAHGAYGYRFWPYRLQGEGFFLAVFRKTSGGEGPYAKTRKKAAGLTEREKSAVSRWMNTDAVELVRHEQTVYAWPMALAYDMNLLLNNLRVIYSGILLGELKHDKLVPDHALALSGFAQEGLPRVELNYDDAIRFLQRKDFSLPDAPKGWSIMTFSGYPIGWANVLPNRVNNYYPRELRILKEKE